jgi:hypothetical protein
MVSKRGRCCHVTCIDSTARWRCGKTSKTKMKKSTWSKPVVHEEVHGEGLVVVELACDMLAMSNGESSVGEGSETKAVDVACQWRAR